MLVNSEIGYSFDTNGKVNVSALVNAVAPVQLEEHQKNSVSLFL